MTNKLNVNYILNRLNTKPSMAFMTINTNIPYDEHGNLEIMPAGIGCKHSFPPVSVKITGIGIYIIKCLLINGKTGNVVDVIGNNPIAVYGTGIFQYVIKTQHTSQKNGNSMFLRFELIEHPTRLISTCDSNSFKTMTYKGAQKILKKYGIDEVPKFYRNIVKPIMHK